MAASSVDPQTVEALLAAFAARLSGSLPFREDSALSDRLLDEARPVLEALAIGYAAREGAQAALHEGFALARLLCRKAALLGATPTVAIVLARALQGALCEAGAALPPSALDDLSVIAVEGYCAGRDEARERDLRAISAETQVWFALAPRCYVVCLAGSHHPEQLQETLEEIARALFRAQARAVLLDLQRLRADDEDSARALVSFAYTLLGLGTELVVSGEATGLGHWFEQLGLRARVASCDFETGLKRVLSACGHELRTRGRLGELMQRVRSGSRA